MSPGQSFAVPCGFVRLGFSLVVDVLRPRPDGQAPPPDEPAILAARSVRGETRIARYVPEWRALVLVRQELFAAFGRFRPADDILEIAGGTGSWTTRLLRHASHVTALDASSEMHQQAAAKRSTVIDASAPAAPSICPSPSSPIAKYRYVSPSVVVDL